MFMDKLYNYQIRITNTGITYLMDKELLILVTQPYNPNRVYGGVTFCWYQSTVQPVLEKPEVHAT